MKKYFLILTALVTALTLLASSAFAGDTWYVATDNGKALNVRYTDSTAYAVLGYLPYGKQVDVIGYTQGGVWGIITWDGLSLSGQDYYGDAFIMMRHMSKEPPAKKPKHTGDANGETTMDFSTVDQINVNLLKAVKMVEPYNVTVHATRASGHIYMRWMPSKKAKEVGTYRDGAQLQVIAELTDWYQVADPETGATGFIYKSYIR